MMQARDIIKRELDRILTDQIGFVAVNLLLVEEEFKYASVISNKSVCAMLPDVIEHIKRINTSKNEYEYVSNMEDFQLVARLFCPEMLEFYNIENIGKLMQQHYTLAYGPYVAYRDLLSKKYDLQKKINDVKNEFNPEDY